MATRATPTTAQDLIAALRRQQGVIVDAYMRELVPSYDRYQDRLADMREAGEQTINLLLRAAAERRTVTASEYDYARAYLRRAMLRGATEHDLLRSARVWQRVLFDQVAELAGPDGAALVAELSRLFIDQVDGLSDLTVEVVEELRTAMRLTARDGRAELVEDLLAGRPIDSAARLGAARACGLAGDASVVVVSARPTTILPDLAAGAVAAVTLSHAAGDAVEPLFAVRGDEVVVVRATADDPRRLVDALKTANDRLMRDGLVMAVGVSAVHDGVRDVPAAYGEACLAREHVAETGGVLAIAIMQPLDYLFARGGDDTAWRLVEPHVRAFIEADLAQAGLLIDTLSAYVEASLNVKQAAERLFVHANTAHYRLAKIQELTGKDLRDLNDLQQLVVAVRLARERAAARA